jgi:hypothetical protein
MEREGESLWPLLALVVAVIALVVYVVANDRAATQHCLETGRTVEECGWR